MNLDLLAQLCIFNPENIIHFLLFFKGDQQQPPSDVDSKTSFADEGEKNPTTVVDFFGKSSKNENFDFFSF